MSSRESSARVSFHDLPASVWEHLEGVLERFEDAWRAGQGPAIDDFLEGTGAERQALLIELVHADLHYRLTAGEPARVENYLSRFPELGGNDAVVLELVLQEQNLRFRQDPAVGISEYLQRFPDLSAQLQGRLGSIINPDAQSGPPTNANVTVSFSGASSLDAKANGYTPMTPGTPPADIVPGYEILGELGRGGMGIVYKARQLKLNRIVALKMILAGSNAAPDELLRFLGEAEAVAHLQHPNVVQIFETGTHAKQPFMVLEFVEGGSLAQKVKDLPLSPNEAARLVEEVAGAMAYAHAKGVVHRDLKPENVLLAADGSPKVTDFGLAKRVEGGAGLTQTGALIGTPSYMAPEQATGQSKEIGPAVDIYSLGALLYRLVAGRPPFQAATSVETLRQVLEQEPVPLRQLQSATPRDLETICLKCLQKQPQRRYTTAADLAEDLRCFLSGKTIRARPVGRIERLVKWVVRRPAAAGLIALAVLTAASLLGLGAWFTEKLRGERDLAEEARRDADSQAKLETEARTLAQQQTHRAEEQSADIYTASGLVATERGDPALAALWFASAAGLARHDEHRSQANKLRFRLWSSPLPQTVGIWNHPSKEKDQPAQIRGETWPGTIAQILPHPDGVHFLARSANSRWALWNIHNPDPIPLPSEAEKIAAATWSSRGDLLAVGTAGGKCLVRRFPELAADHDLPSGQPITELNFSPDGHWLAVARGQELGIWDTSRRTWLVDPLRLAAKVCWLVFDRPGKRLAVASADDAVRIYRLDEGAVEGRPGAIKLVIGPLVNWPTRYHIQSHLAPVWVDEDRALVTCASANEVAWWDAATGKEVCRRATNLWNVDSIVPSPDGKYLAVTGWYGCQLYQAHLGIPIGNPVGKPGQQHKNRVPCAAFSQDSLLLVTGSTDQSVRLWEVPTGDAQGIALQLTNEAFATAYLGKRMLVGHVDGSISLWQSGRPTLPFSDYPLPEDRLVDFTSFIDLEGRHLITQRKGEGIKVMDLASGKPIGPSLEGVVGLFQGAFLGGPGAVIQTRDAVQAWDWQTGKKLWGPRKLPSAGYAIAASPDTNRVVCMCADQGVLLDANTGNIIASFSHPGKPQLGNNIPNVRFSRDGGCFVSFGAWPTVNVWNTNTAKPQFPPLVHEGRVTGITFSDEGSYLATASDDKTARVFDLTTGRELAKLEHPHWVFDVAFSPDGQRLLTTGRDGSARLWDWRTSTLLCPPMSQSFEMFAGCFLPDTSWVVTKTSGGTLQVWDSLGGKPMTPPLATVMGRRGLRLVLGGRKLAAFGDQGQIRVFDLAPLENDPNHHLSGENLRLLAEVQSMHTIHEGGGIVRLTESEWLQRWHRLGPNQPALQTEPPIAADANAHPDPIGTSGKLSEFDLLVVSRRAGNVEIFRVNETAKGANNLTPSTVENNSPAWSYDGTKIAFASNRDGTSNIYVMDADGGNVQQLTKAKARTWLPSWSADGKKIAFCQQGDKGPLIFIMDSDGSHIKQVGPGFVPALSPDGTKIAFASFRAKGFRVSVMDVDGRNLKDLTEVENEFGYTYPAWSPDGKRLAWSDNVDKSIELFVADADGGNRRQLTKLGSTNTYAAWSPDGKRLSFVHRDNFDSIYVMDTDGGNLRMLVRNGAICEEARPAWRPRSGETPQHGKVSGN